MVSPTTIDSLLSSTRLQGVTKADACLRVMDQVRWSFDQGEFFWRARWEGRKYGERIARGALKGRWLAIDLDDTLLMGSLTTADEWGGIGLAHSGLQRSAMKADWWATTKRWLKGKLERVPCKKVHPYLNDPVVEIAFRPGILEGLSELKMAGLGLVLVTASAKERVTYLLQRFPDFAKLFDGPLGRVITAEDMVECQLSMSDGVDASCDAASAEAHRLRPRSLAMKTPWAVSRACGIPAYDLLIDDSETTAKIFHEAGLGEKLLFVEGRHPWSGYGIEILDMAVKRLLGAVPAEAHHVRLACSEEWEAVPSGIPVPPKVEDPLYYPLLHYSDQF